MTRVRVTTPYGLVAAAVAVQPATKRELVGIVRRLERRMCAAPPTQVWATLQDERFVTDRTRGVYADLAGRGAEVRLLARGLQAWLAPGVEGVALDDEDPLVDEWSVVALGQEPVVFAATDLGETPVDDGDRTFRYAVSRDPAVADRCAQALRS